MNSNCNLTTNTFRLCRTCMKQIISTSSICLDSIDSVENVTLKEKLNKCIPELNLSVPSNAVICTDCYNGLNFVHEFRRRCFVTEILIFKYKQVESSTVIDLTDAEPMAVVDLTEEPNSKHETEEVCTNSDSQDHQKSTGRDYLMSLETVALESVVFNNCNNLVADESELIRQSGTFIEASSGNIQKDSEGFEVLKSKTPASRSNLNKKQHKYSKPFKCALCGYQCRQRSYLIIHMRTHTGEKPFKCLYCNFRYSHKSNSAAHMRSHMVKRPFKCSQCKFRFKQRSYLKMHLKTHSTEKPFECHLCGYRCIHKDYLRKHIQNHMKGKLPK